MRHLLLSATETDSRTGPEENPSGMWRNAVSVSTVAVFKQWISKEYQHKLNNQILSNLVIIEKIIGEN